MTYGSVEYAGGPYAAPEGAAPSAGSFPTIAIEVAWTSNPADASPVWVDITNTSGVNRLRQCTVRRGRQRELDQYAAGRASFTLGNADRSFDPNYSTGPFYGYLLPMRRIRCRATYNAVTYPIFDGYIDSIDQEYENPRDAVATISATDAFKVLSNVDLPTSAYALEVAADTPTHWWRLGEPAGSATAFDQGSSRVDGTIGSGVTPGQTGLVSLEDGTATNFALNGNPITVPNGFAYASAVTVEFVVRFDSLPAGNTNIVVAYSAATGEKLAIELRTTGHLQTYVDGIAGTGTGGPNALVAGQTYHIAIVFTPSGGTLYRNGVNVNNDTVAPTATTTDLYIGGNLGLTAATTLQEFTIYNTALSAARVLAHATAVTTPWNGDSPGTRMGRILDFVGWPAAQRQIDTGSSTLQSASLSQTVLDHAQLVEASEFGGMFMARDGAVRFVGRTGFLNQPSLNTFGDGAGELGYADIKVDYSDALIRNDVQVSRTNGVLQRSTDTASVTSFYRHGYQRTGLAHNSDQLSKDAADFLVSEYKDPKQRFTGITLRPGRAPTTMFPAVLGVELADRVTVNRRPQGVGSAISQVSAVEGIAHRFDASQKAWQTELNVSPAYAGAFLQLDLTSGPGLDSLRLYF